MSEAAGGRILLLLLPTYSATILRGNKIVAVLLCALYSYYLPTLYRSLARNFLKGLR